jgi:hypothetical protein
MGCSPRSGSRNGSGIPNVGYLTLCAEETSWPFLKMDLCRWCKWWAKWEHWWLRHHLAVWSCHTSTHLTLMRLGVAPYIYSSNIDETGHHALTNKEIPLSHNLFAFYPIAPSSTPGGNGKRKAVSRCPSSVLTLFLWVETQRCEGHQIAALALLRKSKLAQTLSTCLGLEEQRFYTPTI